MNFIKSYFKKEGERIIVKGQEVYYTKESKQEHTVLVNNKLVNVNAIKCNGNGVLDLAMQAVDKYLEEKYKENSERRKETVLKDFNTGVTGTVVKNTIFQLEDNLEKCIGEKLNIGEVFVLINYNLSIKGGKIEDKYSITIAYTDEDDDEIILEFEGLSVGMISKTTFIEKVSTLLNEIENKGQDMSSEEIKTKFKVINNSMYNTIFELVKVH